MILKMTSITNITKDNTEIELSKINRVLKEFDSSQHFLGEKYESQKEKINALMKDNKKLFLENQKLHGQILELEKCARENKLSTNQLEQYIRPSFMLEISGIPRRKNEDVIELWKIWQQVRKILKDLKRTRFMLRIANIKKRNCTNNC